MNPRATEPAVAHSIARECRRTENAVLPFIRENTRDAIGINFLTNLLGFAAHVICHDMAKWRGFPVKDGRWGRSRREFEHVNGAVRVGSGGMCPVRLDRNASWSRASATAVTDGDVGPPPRRLMPPYGKTAGQRLCYPEAARAVPGL
jgi:hypothetical protein